MQERYELSEGSDALLRFHLLSALKSQIQKDAFPHRKVMLQIYLNRFLLFGRIYRALSASRFTPLKVAIALPFGMITGFKFLRSRSSFPAYFLLPNEKKIIRKLSLLLNNWPIQPTSLHKGIVDYAFAFVFHFFWLLSKPKQTGKTILLLYRLAKKYELYILLRTAQTVFYYRTFCFFLARNEPAACMFASDGSPYGTSIMYVAKSLGIPCVFASHASISGNPSTVHSTIAFFHGQQGAADYQRAGSQFNYVLYYPAKEQLRPLLVPSTAKEKTVLVCLSKDSPEAFVCSLMQNLIRDLNPKQVIVRLHPHSLIQDAIFQATEKVIISRRRTLEDDLSSADWAIAGNSNIHLDCYLAGVPSLYCKQLDPFHDDLLPFIRRGIFPSMPKLDLLSKDFARFFGLLQEDVSLQRIGTFLAIHTDIKTFRAESLRVAEEAGILAKSKQKNFYR